MAKSQRAMTGDGADWHGATASSKGHGLPNGSRELPPGIKTMVGAIYIIGVCIERDGLGYRGGGGSMGILHV